MNEVIRLFIQNVISLSPAAHENSVPAIDKHTKMWLDLRFRVFSERKNRRHSGYMHKYKRKFLDKLIVVKWVIFHFALAVIPLKTAFHNEILTTLSATKDSVALDFKRIGKDHFQFCWNKSLTYRKSILLLPQKIAWADEWRTKRKLFFIVLNCKQTPKV